MKLTRKPAKNTPSSQANQEKMLSLAKAFEIFSHDTNRLETAYNALNEQFQTLSLELQDANHALQNKVAELDILTQYLGSILDHIVQGIIFIDSNGMVTTYNQAAHTLLGIDRIQVLFHSFWQNFQDDVFGFSMREALKKKESETIPYVIYHTPNQTSIELEIMTTFIQKGDPTKQWSSIPQGMIIMIKDITEVRHLQVLADQTNRMKTLGETAAQLAHEIRNPLGGIKGFASLLKRDLNDTPSLQRLASNIVEGTDQLNHLINQILQYARPLQPRFENIDLLALLLETKQYIEADERINQKNITLSIDSPLKELWIPLDPALFKSLLLNLIVNAIQAMPHGGKIVIAANRKLDFATLNISDSGIGMSREHLAKLYSPFFTTKAEGTGLGLREVQKVIIAHGGSIDVSSAVGQGTTFILKIPLKQR